jgi:hypothetical protein
MINCNPILSNRALGDNTQILTKAATSKEGFVLNKTNETSEESLELSGTEWVAKFQGSNSLEDLDSSFREKVRKFIDALHSAGAIVNITSTFRPPERAYLMHWSWRIVKEGYDPCKVPPKGGVNINWWHGALQKSKQAAQDMVNGYSIVAKPSLTSRHTQHKAMDTNISWQGNLGIKQADGTEKTITTTPRDHTNSSLIEVGKTYGVIHYSPVGKDKVHWSTDGR